MSQPSASTVGQLLYGNDPDLNLTRIIGELERILHSVTDRPLKLRRESDETAVCNVGGARFLLSCNDTMSEPWSVCMTVAVGADRDGEDGILARAQAGLARLLVDRIAAGHPPDRILWHRVAVQPDMTLIDRLTHRLMPAAAPSKRRAPARFPLINDDLMCDALAKSEAVMIARTAERTATEEQAAGPRRRRRAGIMQHLHRARIGSTTRRSAPQQMAPPPAAAITLLTAPEPVSPAQTETLLLRQALLGPVQHDPSPRGSAQLRLAAQAMNATVMCMSLPIGATMMAYSMIAGENLTVSARVLALAGTGGTLAQMLFGIDIGSLG